MSIYIGFDVFLDKVKQKAPESEFEQAISEINRKPEINWVQ